MGIVRDSFVIFKNWAEAIEKLPEELQLECYKALAYYGLHGEKPEGMSAITDALLTSFSVGLENSICRYNASVENGKKGGAPKGNQNAKKKVENQVDLEQPKTSKNNLKQPKTSKNNLNVNDNVLASELVKENKKEINVFNKTHAHVQERVKEYPDAERAVFANYFQALTSRLANFDDDYQLLYEVYDTMLEAKEQSSMPEGLVFNQKTYHLKEIVALYGRITEVKLEKIIKQLKFKEDIENRPYYILGCIVNMANEFSKGGENVLL